MYHLWITAVRHMEMHVSRRVHAAAEDADPLLARHLLQFIKALQRAVFSILY